MERERERERNREAETRNRSKKVRFEEGRHHRRHRIKSLGVYFVSRREGPSDILGSFQRITDRNRGGSTDRSGPNPLQDHWSSRPRCSPSRDSCVLSPPGPRGVVLLINGPFPFLRLVYCCRRTLNRRRKSRRGHCFPKGRTSPSDGSEPGRSESPEGRSPVRTGSRGPGRDLSSLVH